MYAYLNGNIAEINKDNIVVDVNGVGYMVYTHKNALGTLKTGENAKIYTHMTVREDDMSLFGFLSKEEKDIFLKLISINGIGPKVALSILSSMKANDVAAAIISGNVSAFEAVSGIGKKTAQRIVLELKEKVDMTAAVGSAVDENGIVNIPADIQGEAVMALMGLGYQRGEAQSAVSAVRNLGDTAESLVLLALKRLAR